MTKTEPCIVLLFEPSDFELCFELRISIFEFLSSETMSKKMAATAVCAPVMAAELR
jgi:hypothetical protein